MQRPNRFSICYYESRGTHRHLRCTDPPRRRKSPQGLAHRRWPQRSGRAGARRDDGQQARGGWWNTEGDVPATPALVARRPPSAAANFPARPRDRRNRCMVRGPGQPPLQPAGTAGPDARRRPAHGATITSTISSSRSTTTRAPRDRGPRQRGIPASGAREFRTDRGMRLDDEIGDAAAVGAAGAETRRSMIGVREARCSTRIRSRLPRKTLHDHWRAGTKLEGLEASLRPRDRAEAYAIQARIENYSSGKTVRLEDRGHQRGRAEAHQCRRPDGRTHPAGDGHSRRRHGFDGGQRDARRRAGIRLSDARGPAAARHALHACRRCSTRSARCIRQSRFRIRVLPISSAPAPSRSSPTMPARICSCSARPQRCDWRALDLVEEKPVITLRGNEIHRSRQERARRSQDCA